jgi:hypothetical protein
MLEISEPKRSSPSMCRLNSVVNRVSDCERLESNEEALVINDVIWRLAAEREESADSREVEREARVVVVLADRCWRSRRRRL